MRLKLRSSSTAQIYLLICVCHMLPSGCAIATGLEYRSHHAETERVCSTRLQKEKVVDLSPKLKFRYVSLNL